MNPPEKIYCIIVTYNAEKWIEKCLNSVMGSSMACTIVVIDNLSDDRTSEIIRTRYPQVRLIQNTENAGFGKANNIGIKLAYEEGADYFFLLNQDAWVEPETIGLLANKLCQHPEYGILSPLHYFNTEKLDWKFKKYIKGTGEEVIRQLSDEERDRIVDVRFVNAALWMINRQCIEKVGLFAPIFSHYGEDQNYAHRCKLHHLKIGIYLKAVGYHEREQSAPKERHITFRKLLYRDKHLCLSILLNLKHRYLRQWLFLLFSSIRDLLKSIVLLKFKTIWVIIYRFSFISRMVELKSQREQMKRSGAFLELY